MTDVETNPLFEQLLAASGLAPILGRPALRRALQRAGVDPDRLSLPDIQRSMDAIEASLKVFLPHDKIASRISAIRRLG